MAISFFDLVSAPRYFHIVAFKYSRDYPLEVYFKDSGFRQLKQYGHSMEYPEFELQHYRLLSNVQYHFGNRDYSANGDGKAPYTYDHFAINIKKSNTLLFAFPYQKMGEDVLERLIEKKGLLSQGKFIRPLLSQLLKKSDGQDFVEDDEGYISTFSSIELKLLGNKDVNLVRLDGPSPLNSSIYKDLFKKLVDEDEGKLAQCALRMATSAGGPDDEKKTKASVHLDYFGNYKIYLHANGRNILVLPFLFKLLKKYKALDYTFINPITKIQDDQF